MLLDPQVDFVTAEHPPVLDQDRASVQDSRQQLWRHQSASH